MFSVKCYILILTSFLFLIACKRNETAEPVPLITNQLSFSENPGNNWQVGYSKSDILDPSEFLPSTFSDTSGPIALWHPAAANAYPYTGQNRTMSAQVHASNQWALRGGEITMEGSNTGQYSMLRFIVPAAGKYRVKAIFEGVHYGLSTTDVHILFNSTHLFDNIIDGYGGDASFHEITGANPTCDYEGELTLKKGDIITFAVGYGANKTHFNDTTGLLLTIEIL